VKIAGFDENYLHRRRAMPGNFGSH
jgi:hypothetical protein